MGHGPWGEEEQDSQLTPPRADLPAWGHCNSLPQQQQQQGRGIASSTSTLDQIQAFAFQKATNSCGMCNSRCRGTAVYASNCPQVTARVRWSASFLLVPREPRFAGAELLAPLISSSKPLSVWRVSGPLLISPTVRPWVEWFCFALS